MKTYWISFATDELGSLGCVIMDAEGDLSAIDNCSKLGIHPGGEVMAMDVTNVANDSEGFRAQIARFGKNRLIPKEELLADECTQLKDVPDDVMEQVMEDPHLIVICEPCVESMKRA